MSNRALKLWVSSTKRLAEMVPTFISRVAGRAPRKVNSAGYWEQRYRKGQTSGAGSYGRLAHFKADFLNSFVAQNNIGSVIEFGNGDGAQLTLAQYPSYVGVDVSETAVRECQRKFADNPSYRFYTLAEFDPLETAELGLSLDVVYHLVEDDVFEDYMHRLFTASRRFTIIYATNEDQINAAAHVRHRRFTDWVSRHRSDFELVETCPNAFPFDPADPENTSPADFFIYRVLDRDSRSN